MSLSVGFPGLRGFERRLQERRDAGDRAVRTFSNASTWVSAVGASVLLDVH